MATESPGEAHAGDGVDLASGGDSDTATDASPGVVGGDTDDEVPEGENYFGRAAKEGAAPAGANPFAAASSAPEDDWATQIAEAKAMVEAQRIAREKEEALERAREMAAAELKGKAYEGRRKAGDPAPETNAETTNAGGAKHGAGSAHSRVRKMLKARRPLGSGERSDASATYKNGSSPAPFSFGGGVLAAPNEPSDAKSEPSPFAGFSLLGDASGAQKKTTPGAVVSAEGDGASKNADRVDFKNPRGGGGVFGRLSGAPAPFEPSSVAEEANDEEEVEEEDEEEDEDDTGVPAVVPLFTNAAPSAATNATPAIPASATSTAGNRTPLAVELDL